MVNYQKTEQAFNNEPIKHPNVRYEKPPEQKGHEAWLQKVTNPHTKTFFQITDLPIRMDLDSKHPMVKSGLHQSSNGSR